ncbi:hypothetical protein L249_7080, partial [Ophiocordyceps polyrhachis-furcata BCC 54312]
MPRKVKRLFAAVEIIMSNQGVDYVIEKKKTNHVIVVFNKVEADNELEYNDVAIRHTFPTTIEVGRYDRYWYSASIARADRCIARRSLPTVTQGVMAGLRYFSRYFKVPTCSTLTYLYKIGDLEEDLYVPYPA